MFEVKVVLKDNRSSIIIEMCLSDQAKRRGQISQRNRYVLPSSMNHMLIIQGFNLLNILFK